MEIMIQATSAYSVQVSNSSSRSRGGSNVGNTKGIQNGENETSDKLHQEGRRCQTELDGDNQDGQEYGRRSKRNTKLGPLAKLGCHERFINGTTLTPNARRRTHDDQRRRQETSPEHESSRTVAQIIDQIQTEGGSQVVHHDDNGRDKRTPAKGEGSQEKQRVRNCQVVGNHKACKSQLEFDTHDSVYQEK